MSPYRSQLAMDLFDHSHPSVSRAKEKYDFKDRSEDEGLTRNNVADAILNLREHEALIIPAGMYWGNETFKHRQTGYEIQINNPHRFRKFGSEINMTKSDATIKEIKETKLTPRKAFRQTLRDSGVREKLKNGAYRGLGYWSPRADRHNIIPFDAPTEGKAYLNFLSNEFVTDYQFADAYQQVPSFDQIKGVRTSKIKVLPVTGRSSEYLVEWLEENAECNCAYSFFMETRSKKKIGSKFEGIYKYKNPEQVICRHNWTQRILAEKEAERNPNAKPLLVKWPEATGLMEPWRKTKMQVYVWDKSGLRRPYKAEIVAITGNILGILEPDYAFDLSE